MADKELNLLLETLFEMTCVYQAMRDDDFYFAHDSRADRDSLIHLSKCFEEKHRNTEWNDATSPDYYDEIKKFFHAHMRPIGVAI